jgi:hypothetical protein
MIHRPGLWSRLRCLEQQRHASTRRILVYYEDSRLAGETEAEAMARQGIAPAPQDIVLRVRYEETRPDTLSPHNATGPLGKRPGRPVPEDWVGVVDRGGPA